jgi:hypothetical protein
LVYVFHVHKPDYTRMKMLLAYAKEWKVWHKHWGNSAFIVEMPTELSSRKDAVHPNDLDTWVCPT